MSDAKLAPNLPGWMIEHVNRYLTSGGNEGHLYKMTQPGLPGLTVPSLLLTTTGRKSGERFIFPCFTGRTATAISWSPRRAARQRIPVGIATSLPTPGRGAGRHQEAEGSRPHGHRR